MASPSLSLATPWYLDYGHLTFWFLVGTTIVIILWLTYTFSSLTRNIEERRPVRETRGFSRAQTGDALTAVLPLTWSITMLGHASTHSINFDENTTATTFSFTVVAYQWGWNYFFPREVVELLATAPRLTGRGRVIGGHAQDRYSALLARARGDYVSQLTLNELLTAKHGRHVVSGTLSLLLPVLAGTVETLPQWVQLGAASALSGQTAGGDARLLQGLVADTALTRSVQAQALWQRHSHSLLPERLAMTVSPSGTTFVPTQLRGATASSAIVSGHAVAGVPAVQTQGLRPLSSSVWVGNRLQRIHAHMTAASASQSLGTRVSLLAALVRRQTLAVPFDAILPAARFNGIRGLAPTAVANVSLNLNRAIASPTTLAVAWTESALGQQNGRIAHAGRAVTVGSLPALGLQLALVGLAPSGSVCPQLPAPTLVGAARVSSEAATLAVAVRQASQRHLTGDALGVIGGDARALGPNDTAANTAAPAFEWMQTATTERGSTSAAPAGLTGSAQVRLDAVAREGVLGNASRAVAGRTWLTQTGTQPHASTLTKASAPCLAGLALRPGSLFADAIELAGTAASGAGVDSNWSTFCARRLNLAPLAYAAVAARSSSSSASAAVEAARFRSPSAQLTPSLTVATLDAVSELVPTRTAASVFGDPVQLNGRGTVAGASAATPAAASVLGAWRQLWSWHTLSAGFPWDRAYRTQFNRRPGSGLGQAQIAQVHLQQTGLLALQRQRFDKAAFTLLRPKHTLALRQLWHSELAPAVLDAERGVLLSTSAVILPLPYLDLDPTFLLTRWAAEINTSRRSDHDTRFKVLWGPLAAAAAGTNTTSAWVETSGPRVSASIPLSARRQLSWLFAQAEARTLTARATQPVQLLRSFNGHGAAHLSQSAHQGLGFVGPQLSAVQYLTAAARVITQPRSGGQLYGAASGISQVSPYWATLWAWRSASPRIAPTAVASPSAAYWTTRFAATSATLIARLGLITSLDTPEASACAVNLTGLRYSFEAILQDGAPSREASLIGSLRDAVVGAPQPLSSATAHWDGLRAGYEALRVDVGAMRRLRVTKGIYLPADTPMHGIFGSKDVIHSWAIPGLGVKIDCIPGYSSHRRLILRWRGLFWGQCMEVCGRYHHWMPILVRVAHRDVFTLWCLTYLRALAVRAAAGANLVNVETMEHVWTVAAQTTQHAHRAV